MSKKNKTILLLLSFAFLFLIPQLSFAQESYVINLINPVAEIFGQDGSRPDIPALFNNVFKLSLGLASAVAVIMITVAGFEYIAAESFGQKGEAKKRIWGAVYGAGMLAVSYVLINTINPRLMQFEFPDAPTSPAPVDIFAGPHTFTYTNNLTNISYQYGPNGSISAPVPANRDQCIAKRLEVESIKVPATVNYAMSCVGGATNPNFGTNIFSLQYKKWKLPKPERNGNLEHDTETDYSPARQTIDLCASDRHVFLMQTAVPSYASQACTRRRDSPPLFGYSYTWQGRSYTSKAPYGTVELCEAGRSADMAPERVYHSFGTCQSIPLTEAMENGLVNTRYCLTITSLPQPKQVGCFTDLADCETAKNAGAPLYTVGTCTPTGPATPPPANN